MRASGRPPGGALLIVADGLAESPGEKTTLFRARTPVLDRLSRQGRLFRLDPQGGAPEESVTSERGIAALLGLGRIDDANLSRGGLLSLLADLPSVREAVPLSSWFYVATPVRYSEGGEGTLQSYVNDPAWESALWHTLIERLPSVRNFDLFPVFERPSSGVSRRGERILRMLARFSAPLTQEAVPATGFPPRTGRLKREALAPSFFMEWFSREILRCEGGRRTDQEGRGDPGLWLWGGGPRPSPPLAPHPDRFLVAQAALVRALGRLAGYADLPLCRATGETDTDLAEKLSQVRTALLSGARRVVLHVEGFDMASHRKDPEGKRRFLERFDQEVLAPVSGMLLSGELEALGMTSDHRSSPWTGNHAAGPVPALLLNGDTFGKPERAGARMTEEAAERSPIASMEHWNGLLFSDPASTAGRRDNNLRERTTCRESS